MSNLDEAIKEAYARNDSRTIYIETLEFRSPHLSESLFIVKGHQNITATLEDASEVTFLAVPFNFTTPEASATGGVQELRLIVDDLTRQPSRFCRTAMEFDEPLEVFYRPYLASDLSAPKLDPPLALFLANVSVSNGVLSARATTFNFMDQRFPAELYNRVEFPSLGDL